MDAYSPDHVRDPMTAVHGTCPGCGTAITLTYRNFAKPIALAVYDGIPGGRPADDDVEMLRRIATWLDRIDAATDTEFDAAGSKHRAVESDGPTIQDDLRRIAARIETTDA
jgi:hypothetical protein